MTHTTQAVDLLKQMITIPSHSRQETAVADMLQHTIEHHYQYPTHRLYNNIWTIDPHYDPRRPTLLLNAHIDTVKPVSTWSRPPYQPTIEGDTLYGLGSNDDGASVVTLLQAYHILTQSHPLPYNLIYLASAEEEVSGSQGIESVIPQLPKIDVALVGEPTSMQPAQAEKGLMVIDATAHGTSGHAARDTGDNAIYHALDDINWLRHHTLPLVSPLLGPVKTTTTIINAGTQHNVVPDRCTFTIDVRSNECYTNQEILHHLQQGCHSTLKPRSLRLSSSHISPDHPLLQRAIALGRTPFGSPTLSDQALMPWPSMKMGPGESTRSHTADEYIRISEIDEAITLYVEMLQNLELTPQV